MKYSYAIAALAAAATASDVHDLTKDSFKDFVNGNQLALVEFFAPWCGHCKALAPEYEEAATTLKEKDIALAKVDCTVEADLCKDYGVEGYPTVKVFRGPDNPALYTGARKAPAIVSYMTKQALPAVTTVTSENFEEFKASDKVVVVAYFAADDKTSNATFTEVANSLRDNYLFGATNDASLAKAQGASQPGLVLYKSFDEGKDVFSDKFTKDDIAKFAKVAATPLIGEVNPETYQGYMEAGIPLAYIFASEESERTEFASNLKEVAKKHKGQVNIATIDAKLYGSHAGNLNLPADKFPSFAIQHIGKNEKYPLASETEITEKTIGEFVQQFLDGKVEPSIKSEPIPEKQEGPTTVIVAKSYKDIVMDDAKDVLVEFYAPWCGHCKALAPKYDQLAQSFSGNSKLITIAKIDATANDVPEQIQGFPTIKLFPAGNKSSPIDYSGDRSVEDLAKFVKENGAHHVEAVFQQDTEMPDAEEVGEAAKAATEKAEEKAEGAKATVKSVVSEAAEAVKTVVGDTEDQVHDEL